MMENKEENILMERFSLCRERISQVGEELLPEAAFRDYFTVRQSRRSCLYRNICMWRKVKRKRRG